MSAAGAECVRVREHEGRWAACSSFASCSEESGARDACGRWEQADMVSNVWCVGTRARWRAAAAAAAAAAHLQLSRELRLLEASRRLVASLGKVAGERRKPARVPPPRTTAHLAAPRRRTTRVHRARAQAVDVRSAREVEVVLEGRVSTRVGGEPRQLHEGRRGAHGVSFSVGTGSDGAGRARRCARVAGLRATWSARSLFSLANERVSSQIFMASSPCGFFGLANLGHVPPEAPSASEPAPTREGSSGPPVGR